MGKLYTYDGADWVEVVGATGASGTNGTDGKTILNGAIDPTTEGVDGDFYINTVANTIFGPKAAGVWGTGTSIVGAAGADGADGLTVSVNSVTQVAGDISLTQDNIPDGTTNKAYTATEQTKLAGIETAADVTDATNVAAAGAIMDGDFTGNGLMTRTGAGTYTNRTITGTSNQITVTNGDGVSGNPTLSLPQDIHTGASPTFAEVYAKSSVGNGYISIESAAAQNASSMNLIGHNASNDGDTYTTSIRTNFADVLSYVHDASSDTYHNFFQFSYLNDRLGLPNTSPFIDSTYTLGTSYLYWSNTYTDKIWFNSTSTIDGSTAGVAKVTGKLTIGTAPTYTISNVSTDRSYDANSTTLDEVADALGTLIADLRAMGLVL